MHLMSNNIFAMELNIQSSKRNRNAFDSLKTVILLSRIFAILPFIVERNEIKISKISKVYSQSISMFIITSLLILTIEIITLDYSSFTFHDVLFLQQVFVKLLRISASAALVLFKLSNLKLFWKQFLKIDQAFFCETSKWKNKFISYIVTTQLFIRCFSPYFALKMLHFNITQMFLPIFTLSIGELYCFCSIIFYVKITCFLQTYYQNIYQDLCNIDMNNMKTSILIINKSTMLHQKVTDLKNIFNTTISLPVMSIFLDHFIGLCVNIYNCILKIIGWENQFTIIFSTSQFIYLILDYLMTIGILIFTSFSCARTVSRIIDLKYINLINCSLFNNDGAL